MANDVAERSGARQEKPNGESGARQNQPLQMSPVADSARGSLQRAQIFPNTLRPADIQNLQRTIGNRATERLLQTKLRSDHLPDISRDTPNQAPGPLIPARRQPHVQRDEEKNRSIWANRYADSVPTQAVDPHPTPFEGFVTPPPLHEIQRKKSVQGRGTVRLAAETNPATLVFRSKQPTIIQRQLVNAGPPRTRRVRDTRDGTGQIMQLINFEPGALTVRKAAGDVPGGWITANYIYDEGSRQYTQQADPRMVWAPDLNAQLKRQGDFYKNELQDWLFHYDRSTFRYVRILPLGDGHTYVRQLKNDLFETLDGSTFYQLVQDRGFRRIAQEPDDDATASMVLRNGGRLAPPMVVNDFVYVRVPTEAVDATILGWLDRYQELSGAENDIERRELYDRAHTMATDIYQNLPEEEEEGSMEEDDENEEFRGVADAATGTLQAAAWVQWRGGGVHVEYIVGSPDNLSGVPAARGAPSTLMRLILQETQTDDVDNTISLDALPGTVASYVKMGFEEN